MDPSPRQSHLGRVGRSPPIPRTCFAYPPPDFKIRCETHLVAELADQVRRNEAGEAPAGAAQPHALSAGRADLRHTGVARRHPGRPRRPATDRATPARQGHASLATATRQATCRHGHPLRLASNARLRSPRRHRGPIPTGARGKAKQPHPGRLHATDLVRSAAAAGPLPDDHPAAALWWRILDQLALQTPNQDPAKPAAPSQRPDARPRPHTTSSAPEPALGAASGVRPEPLKPRQITTREVSR